jgi:hypothetical protein
MKQETVSIIAALGSAAAAIAAGVATWVAYKNGSRQLESAQAVARMNLIMPMREAWIGQLRTKLSWYLGTCAKLLYKISASPDDDGRALVIVRFEIRLMLNVDGDDTHKELDLAINGLLGVATPGENNRGKYEELAKKARALSEVVLKSEWQRAKTGT